MTEEERNEYRTTMRALTTRSEKQRFRAAHHQEMQVRADAKGVTLAPLRRAEQPASGKGHGPRTGNRNKRAPTFADFDTDRDGYINQDEFVAGHAIRSKHRAAEGRKMKNAGDLSLRFSEIDTDDDGLATQSEFTAHQETRRNMHRSERRLKEPG